MNIKNMYLYDIAITINQQGQWEKTGIVTKRTLTSPNQVASIS